MSAAQSMTKPRRDPIAGVAALLVATVIVGAFVVSFAVLRDLAAQFGIPANVAWIWPVIVDGTIAAATTVLYAGRQLERRQKRLPAFALMLFVLVSVVGNVAHNLMLGDATASPAWLKVFVSTVPPVGLLLSVELFITLLRIRSAKSEGDVASVTSMTAVTKSPDLAKSPDVNMTPHVTPMTQGGISQVPQTAATFRSDPVVTGVTDAGQSDGFTVTDVTDVTKSRDLPVMQSVTSGASALGASYGDDAVLTESVEMFKSPDLPVTRSEIHVTRPVEPAKQTVTPPFTPSVPADPAGQVTWIVERAREGRDVTKPALMDLLAKSGHSASDSTVQRRLKDARTQAPEAFEAAHQKMEMVS